MHLFLTVTFGINDDNPFFIEQASDFLSQQFFPYLQENNITEVFHLGDTFDRRKYGNFATLDRFKHDWFDRFDNSNLNLYTIAGNHDVYYKNTNSVSSPLFFLEGKHPYIFQDVHTFELANKKILCVPWIPNDSDIRQHLLQEIDKSTADIVFGHFELAGFVSSLVNERLSDGLDPKILKRFPMVASGHYHHKSTKGNIHYLGAPYEMRWDDADDPKGFHILDLDSMKLDFIINPAPMHLRVLYDDTDLTEFPAPDTDKYKNKVVRIIEGNVTNRYWFETFVETIEAAGVASIRVEEKLSENYSTEEDTELNVYDGRQVVSNYCSTNIEDTSIRDELLSIYEEAVNI